MQQLAHKLGRGYDMKEEQELLETEESMRLHGSNMRLSQPDSSVDNEAQVINNNLNSIVFSLFKNLILMKKKKLVRYKKNSYVKYGTQGISFFINVFLYFVPKLSYTSQVQLMKNKYGLIYQSD